MDKPKLGKSELWITEAEAEDWDLSKADKWEIVERDLIRARIKIRRIDNGRGTSETM